jgi:putative selenate reductase molybdopterin-binding subunit
LAGRRHLALLRTAATSAPIARLARIRPLYERMVFDEQGRVVNPTFRNYHIPAFADAPRTEVFFADMRDAIGPLGAKGIGECRVNLVAPALANALADATGARFRDLPFTPDRIYRRIFERHVV